MVDEMKKKDLPAAHPRFGRRLLDRNQQMIIHNLNMAA
jgi:hypothetical protein